MSQEIYFRRQLQHIVPSAVLRTKTINALLVLAFVVALCATAVMTVHKSEWTLPVFAVGIFLGDLLEQRNQRAAGRLALVPACAFGVGLIIHAYFAT